MGRINRRALLLLGAGGAAAAAYPWFIEPGWLELTETRVRLRRTRHEPLRLAHLSDLHASSATAVTLIEQAVARALANQPDVACITGDFITAGAAANPGKCVQALQRLASRVPTFAVLGNHDGGRWAQHRRGPADTRLVQRLIDEGGVELLHNRSKLLEVRGEKISLVGVGDLWAEQIDSRRAFADVERRHPTILLSHNPDSKQVLAQHDWDLMLSGHTHGGQVRMPFWEEGFAPVLDKRYVAGLKAWEDRQIYVSRGVGNLLGVRFRCRPEVSILLVG